MKALARLLAWLNEQRRRHPRGFLVACGILCALIVLPQSLRNNHADIMAAYQRDYQYADFTIARTFATNGELAVRPGYPSYWRPPGHPLWLGAWMRLLGESYPSILLLFTVYLGFAGLAGACSASLAMTFSGQAVAGPIAAGLFATSPVVAAYANAFVGDVPAAALHGSWLVLCVGVLRQRESPRPRQLLAIGLALAAASFLRPVATLFPVLLLVLGVLWRSQRRRLVPVAVASLAGALAFSLPWATRNYLVCDDFSTFSQPSVNLWAGSSWETRGLWHGKPADEFNRSWKTLPLTQPPRCFEQEMEADYARRWRENLRSQPAWQFPVLWLRNAARVWFGLDVGANQGIVFVFFRRLIPHQIVLLVLCVAMFLRRGGSTGSGPALVLVLGFSAFITALAALVPGEPRLALPFLPVLCALAAGGLAALLEPRERGAPGAARETDDG
ncbi:MAG: hypothetical protein ABW217_00840 [Polyangiaceae bacterium]